ncbi:MAG: pyridoxal phosphate-dependent aminotransferase [Lachnospiraceae bacterium]|nr:pyridoxal phosphate-dependent aminotransferase [Lachnospiraceae bacterium]
MQTKKRYDFDTVIDRSGTDASKWEVAAGELPMWVADMDFATAPEIREALAERLANGIFGYTEVSDRFRDAYGKWWKERHGFAMDRDGLLFVTGVIPAISSIVRKLTTPNENVVIQTPVYNIFFNCIKNNGCRVSESPLVYRDGEYAMDLADLEKKLADPQTNLMILCNPHNPVGKIWDRGTLARIGELAKQYHVTVISDEIHCDITKPGREYVPFAAVSDTCEEVSITCIAPTKAFNIAGLQTAAVYVPDPVLRHKVWRAINTDEVAEPNAFATVAAIAAFEKGGAWLDAMRDYVFENRRFVEEELAKALPDVHVVPGEATYLLWIDVSAYPGDSRGIADYLRTETGLFVSNGVQYGTGGAHHLRMNVACPRALCEDGVKRLITGLTALRGERR